VAPDTVNTRRPLTVSDRFDPHIRLDLFLKDSGLMLEEGSA
jgi:hypothetical protein